MAAAFAAVHTFASYPAMFRDAATLADTTIPGVRLRAATAAAAAVESATLEFPVVALIPHQAALRTAATGPGMILVAQLAAALTAATNPMMTEQTVVAHSVLSWFTISVESTLANPKSES